MTPSRQVSGWAILSIWMVTCLVIGRYGTEREELPEGFSGVVVRTDRLLRLEVT
jgi:hypothetical protein